MRQGQYMVFRVAMPCSLVDRCCVGVTYCFHLQDRRFSSVGKDCVNIRGGADKSLARPGRKQATGTKLGIYSTRSP